MCQLTFINLHITELNNLFTVTQALANTITDHKDGFGFYSGESVTKFEKSPWIMLNFSDYLPKKSKNNPNLLHVRKASWINADKLIDEEHTHPFESKNFILAHNGTLELVDKIFPEPANYKNKIDSQIFLSVLDDEYEKTQDFVNAIKSAVSKFYGKFAFLIYEKSTKNYYAVRDNNASLYIFRPKIYAKNTEKKEVDLIDGRGYIINTQKDSFIHGLVNFSNHLLLRNYRLDWTELEKNIEELGANSIFLLEKNDIKLISSIDSRPKPEVKAAANFTGIYGGKTTKNTVTGGLDSDTADKYKLENELLEAAKKSILNFMAEFAVSFWYVEHLAFLTEMKSLTSFSEKEILVFSKFLEILMDAFNSPVGQVNEIYHLWDKIKSVTFDELEIYDHDLKLEFPYFLNNKEDLEDVYNEIKSKIDSKDKPTTALLL